MEELSLMPIDVPSNPKVYTTVYDNFKGVDFTNDSTNIWRRRSPTGTNMLPDASGRPFKRHGWEILLSNRDIAYVFGYFTYETESIDEDTFDENKTEYYTESGGVYTQCTEEDVFDENETYYVRVVNKNVEILKCSYFELAGRDHIVVFTNLGVLFYNGDENINVNGVKGITALNNSDSDCYTSYDRCFFFEGGGTSAFYIYGNFKVWIYGADFTLRDATDEAHIPSVLIGATADCVGNVNEPYNLLRNMAAVEYGDDTLFSYWGTDGLVFEVDASVFQASYPLGSNPTYYKWKYDGSSWSAIEGGVSLPSSITPVNPSTSNEIALAYCKGLMLPNNVDVTTQYSQVTVWTTIAEQFDTSLTTVSASGQLTPSTCWLHTDDVDRKNRQAWVEFDGSASYKSASDFDQMDTFKSIFPSTLIKVTPIPSASACFSGSATLGGGA